MSTRYEDGKLGKEVTFCFESELCFVLLVLRFDNRCCPYVFVCFFTQLLLPPPPPLLVYLLMCVSPGCCPFLFLIFSWLSLA